MSLYVKGGEILSPPQSLIQFSHKYDRNLYCISGLRGSSLAMNKWFNLFRVWDWVLLYLYSLSVPAYILRLDWYSCMQIWVDAGKSFSLHTSWCRRTESIVSLERGVCACAEFQVFSCYRGWNEAR